VGVLFLNWSAFLINDSIDFESGSDRISVRSENPLTQGWIGLARLKRISWLFLICGALFGLPAAWVFPQVFIVVAAPAALALWFWWQPSYSFKSSFVAELMVSVLYGVGIVAGYSLGISGYLDPALLLMGWVFSSLFLVVINARNFEHLIAQHLMSRFNFVHRLGFDRSRFYLLFLWGVSGMSVIAWQAFFGGLFWATLFAVHYLLLGIMFWAQSRKVMSPLGSKKRKLSKAYRGAVFSVYLLLLLQIAVLGF
jgi:1,4-dihydroxy-2-naphthoate octaprenyltransferase